MLERVDAPPLHGAVLHDRQSVQEHLRARHGRAARTGPVRVGVGGAGERSGERFGPCGVDLGGVPRPQPACLHQFGAHHPLRGRLGYGGGGEQGEMRAARALIVVLRHLLRTFHRACPCRSLEPGEIGSLRLAHDLHAHHGQQAGKHGRVDACASHEQHSECAACWLSGNWRISNGGRDTGIGSPSLNLNSRHHFAQLGDQILPLAHAQPTQVLGLADAAQCGIVWFAISLEHAVPQVQRGQEVTGRVRIPVVDAVRLLTVLIGTFARILQAEERHDHQYGGQCVRRG